MLVTDRHIIAMKLSCLCNVEPEDGVLRNYAKSPTTTSVSWKEAEPRRSNVTNDSNTQFPAQSKYTIVIERDHPPKDEELETTRPRQNSQCASEGNDKSRTGVVHFHIEYRFGRIRLFESVK